MANTFTIDYPATSPNDESDPEEKEPVEEQEEGSKPVKVAANLQELLKKLHSSGAILPKIKKEQRCVTCDETFPNWSELETHLLQHVTLPLLVLDKLPSDDEDAPSGDEPWTDEEDETPPTPAPKTPQKIDVSQLMKKTGITIKSPAKSQNGENSSSALDKLSGLGFTIKKSTTPIKEEKSDQEPKKAEDVMQKLGKLGGLKLKITSDGTANSFKVVNGLKDFKTSDDDDEEGIGNEKEAQDDGAESDEEQEKGTSEGDPDSADEQNQNDSKDSEEEIPLANENIVNAINKRLQKEEPEQEDTKVPVKPSPSPVKPPGRPCIKQTPKRSDNPITVRQLQQQSTAPPVISTPTSISSTPERRSSNNSITTEVLTVKQEAETEEAPSSDMPLFSGQIKSERSSPALDINNISTPIIANVKTETGELAQTTSAQPLFQNTPSTTTPLMPVTKQEDTGVTIIEINEDDDDDCCVVSSTPASDVKPVIPKIETSVASSTYAAPPVYSTSQPSYGTASAAMLGARLGLTTEKQHSFDWNAPDTKAPMDILYKSTDDIFDSTFSSKKENHSLANASEYISLDTLGPQHSCEVCNTRYTNISLLEEHKRMTGHSSSLITPSSNLMPYGQSSSILSSLLPVKQLAEQVGKLSTINSSAPGFTHQQNVMINIQAYPGSGGMISTPQGYNAYQQQQHSGFHQQPQPNNMYVTPGQAMSGQYPGQTFVTPQGTQVYGQQYQPQMSNAGYSVSMPQNSYSSPLHGMQQAVYAQSPGMTPSQPGQMGPPLPPGQAHSPYKTSSSPVGGNNIRIQNVQTFQPGQQLGSPGQATGNQMPPPGPIRMAAGVNLGKPRMIGVRGARPVMKQGPQMQGQARGPRPRMPMKRPMNMMGAPPQKRRTDMLLPGKHDNEDCQVMAMQKQREGMPMIHSVQGAKDKLNLPSGISVTKKPVNKAAAMANVLAARGISVKQKPKSRSPSPERPLPHIPNLGAGMSIKHTSKSSNFSIPEAKVGGMHSCRVCRKGFANQNSLAMHMAAAHPSSKIPMFKCDECPASYPKSLQLQHHKRTFHNVVGANRELGLPVVDMSQEENLQKLSNLGIYTFIPLANRDNMDGTFGIPVISVHNMQNGMNSGLQALGADGLLSLGPLKPLPN